MNDKVRDAWDSATRENSKSSPLNAMSNELTGNLHYGHQVTGSSYNPRWLFDTQTTETVDQVYSVSLYY